MCKPKCATLYLLSTLLLGSLGWTACQPQPAVETPKYRPLTSAEIQKVSREENFIAVAVKQHDYATVILYDCKNGKDYGDYIGTIAQDGKQSYSQVGSCSRSDEPDSSRVVSFISGQLLSNGDRSSGVIIHDQTIARKVQLAKAIFSDGWQVIVPTNGQRGVFVPVPASKTMAFQGIILYTADGEEVYRSRYLTQNTRKLL